MCIRDRPETCPNRILIRAFPVQAVQERREKRTGERAPRYAHHLRDEGNGGIVLYDGDYDGNGNEHHDQNADDKQAFFLACAAHKSFAEKVERKR